MEITFHSNRVFGQNLLRRNIESDCPQIDHFDFINAGDDEEQAWTNSASLVSAKQWEELKIWQYLTFYLLQSSKPEDDGSLVLRDDADAEEDGDREGENDEDDREGHQQSRATTSRGIFPIVIHPHNLEREKIK